MCLFKAPSMPSMSLTARDILPKTEAETPDSPHFGTDDDLEGAIKRKGKETLTIKKDDENAYRPTNF